MGLNTPIIIGIGVGVPVVIFAVLAGLDASSAQQLQFMTVENEEFDLMSLSMDTTYAVCNPTSFPTSFDKIYAKMYYKSKEIGDFTIWGDSIPAKQAKDVTGRININGETVLQMFLGGLAGAFTGKSTEFDPKGFNIDLKIEKSILGFIPYDTEKKITGANISEIQKFFATSESGRWDCGYSPILEQIVRDAGVEPTQELLSLALENQKLKAKACPEEFISELEMQEIYRTAEQRIIDLESNSNVLNKENDSLGLAIVNDFFTTYTACESKAIYGVLYSTQGNRGLLSSVTIFLIDSETNQKLESTVTNENGVFVFIYTPESNLDFVNGVASQSIAVKAGALILDLGNFTILEK